MKKFKFKLVSLFVAMFFIMNINAQNIIISENLNANSEPLKVKIGKWKFGEYSVVSSKSGWTEATFKSNFFNTKTESKTTQKFSFVMCNKESDCALVNAAKNVEIKEVQGFELFPNFYLGEDEVKVNASNFMALITINNDTTDTWVLLMNSEWGSEVEYSGEAILTNGIKKYLIFATNSNLNGTDKRKLPAMGYEFREKDHAVLALQYYGGGVLGYNKNMVWIDNTQNQKMKLILAATATAIFQLKFSEIDALQ